jgi:hypothetical protein
MAVPSDSATLAAARSDDRSSPEVIAMHPFAHFVVLMANGRPRPDPSDLTPRGDRPGDIPLPLPLDEFTLLSWRAWASRVDPDAPAGERLEPRRVTTRLGGRGAVGGAI